MKVNNISFSANLPKAKLGKDFLKLAEENREYRRWDSMTIKDEFYGFGVVGESLSQGLPVDKSQKQGRKGLRGLLSNFVTRIFPRK